MVATKAHMVTVLRNRLAAYKARQAEWDAAVDAMQALKTDDPGFNAAVKACDKAAERTRDEATVMVGAVASLLGEP